MSLWLPVVAWAALIFVLSSVEASMGLGGIDSAAQARRTFHAARRAARARSGRCRVLLGVAYAVSDEVHQHFVPGRNAHRSTWRSTRSAWRSIVLFRRVA